MTQIFKIWPQKCIKKNNTFKVNTHTFTRMLGLYLINLSCKNFLNDPK